MNSNPTYIHTSYFTALGIYISLSGDIRAIYTFTTVKVFPSILNSKTSISD